MKIWLALAVLLAPIRTWMRAALAAEAASCEGANACATRKVCVRMGLSPARVGTHSSDEESGGTHGELGGRREGGWRRVWTARRVEETVVRKGGGRGMVGYLSSRVRSPRTQQNQTTLATRTANPGHHPMRASPENTRQSAHPDWRSIFTPPITLHLDVIQYGSSPGKSNRTTHRDVQGET